MPLRSRYARRHDRDPPTPVVVPHLPSQDSPLDLAQWITKPDAARQLGVSTKAIERWTRRGKLQQRFRPQPGSPHVAVYHPDDLSALMGQRRPPHVMSDTAQERYTVATGSNGHPPTADPASETGPRSLGTGLAPHGDRVQHMATLLSEIWPFLDRDVSRLSRSVLFLTLAEASAYSGLSQACLLRLIKDEQLRAIKDRGWRIRRKDLDAL